MRVEESGTWFEMGDVSYIGFENAVCPMCGRDLEDVYYVTGGGHLHTPFSEIRTAVFSACTEHFEEAQKAVIRRNFVKQRCGYVGEWEPKLGLRALVCTNTPDDRYEYVRII